MREITKFQRIFCSVAFVLLAAVFIFADTWDTTTTSDFSTGTLTGANVVSDAVAMNFQGTVWDPDASWWNPAASWWDASWAYRKPVIIANDNASALSDFQVKVENPVYNETNLLGSWHFEEGAGTYTEDKSGNYLPGTLSIGGGGTNSTVALAWSNGASGKFDRALSFDGTDDYVTVGNLDSNILTMNCWVKRGRISAPAGTDRLLVSVNNNGWGIGFNSTSNNLFFSKVAVGMVTSTGTIADTTNWHMVSVTYDGANVRFYIDGVLDSTQAYVQTFSSAGNYTIGSRAAAEYFQGLIDEMKVYTRVLSPVEIKSLFDAKAKLNYFDMRFTGFSGTLLDHYMEKDGVFWVELPGASSIPLGQTTIFNYYGNASGADASSGANTFPFFDDFTGASVDLTKWDISGSVTVANSVVTLNRNAGTNAGLYSKTTATSLTSFFVEALYQRPAAAFRNRIYLTTVYGSGSPIGADAGDFDPSLYWNGFTGTTLTANTWYLTTWINSPTDYIWKFNTLAGALTWSRNYGSAISAAKYLSYSGTEADSSDFSFNWVRVRNYSVRDLQVSVAGEVSQTQAFSYRKQFNVVNTGSSLADYQVKVENPVYDETGLVGSWHFDEGTGSVVYDSSGSFMNGTWTGTGSNWSPTGKFGSAGVFNGTTDYVGVTNLPGLPTGNMNYAIEAWIKPTAMGTCGIVGWGTWSSNACNGLRLTATGIRHYWWGNDIDVTVGNLTDGNWHHVIAQFDGTTRSIWVDGVQMNSDTPVGHIMTASNFRIGSSNSAEYFNGSLDEVRVYNRALDAREIYAHYASNMNMNYSDVRFVTAAGQYLPHWMEKDGTFWVRFPGTAGLPAGTTSAMMYYGNSTAASCSNGSTTFPFFDDFSKDLGKWTVGVGTWSVVNGEAKHTMGGGGWDWLYRTETIVDGVWESKIRIVNDASTNHELGLVVRGTTAGIDGTNIQTLARVEDGDIYYNDWAGAATAVKAFAYATYHRQTLAASGVNVTVKWDNALFITDTTTHTTESVMGYRSVQSESYIDWVYLRRYAATEPVVGLGSEMSSSSEWGAKKTVTVTNSTGGALSNYQIKMVNPIVDETSLAGSWHLDGNTSGALGSGVKFPDTAGDGYVGTVSNVDKAGMAWAVGNTDGAVYFDGVDDRITLGTTSPMRQSFAISYAFWVKVPTGGGGSAMGVGASGGEGYGGIEVTQSVIRFYWTPTAPASDTTITADVSLTADTWYHVAVAVDFAANMGAIYLDGVACTTALSQQVTAWAPTTTFNTGQTDSIGGRFVNSWTYFEGTLDEVRVYSKALSQEETQALMYSKAKLNYADLRFVSDLGIEYPYWVEKDGLVWVRALGVDSLPVGASTLTMYHGSANAASASSGRNTFDIFDDFNGTAIDTAQWYGTTSSAFVSSGYLAYAPAGTESMATAKRMAGDFSFRSHDKITTTAGGAGSLGPGNLDYLLSAYKEMGLSGAQLFMSLYNGSALQVSTNWTHDAWKTTDILLDKGARVDWMENGVACSSSPNSTNAPDGDMSIMAYASSLSVVNVDWVLARGYALTEPSVSYGATTTKYTSSGTFLSAIYNTSDVGTFFNSVAWTDSDPGTVNMEIRSSDINYGWTLGNPSWESVSNGDVSIATQGRYVQFRATFIGYGLTENPTLSDVTVTYTLAVEPPAGSVSCDRVAGTWYGTTPFIMTNDAGFGVAIDEIYYVWDQLPYHTGWDYSEDMWTSGTLALDAGGQGSWYFHYLPVSLTNNVGAPETIGPFNYGTEVVSPGGSVACDRVVGEWYDTADYTFTNTVGFGEEIDVYYFVLDKNTTYTSWTYAESTWSSGTLALEFPTEGRWYLHYYPFTAYGTPGTPEDIGPFNFDLTLLVTPALILPTADSTVGTAAPSFYWGSNEPGAVFNLQVSAVDTFASLIVNKTGMIVNSYAMTGSSTEMLLGGTKYYWRVGIVNDYDQVGVSETRTFTVSAKSIPSIVNNTTGQAYSTVQGAISSADTLAGDVITVGSGKTFTESLVISKNITLDTAVLAPTSGFAAVGQGDGGGEVLRNCVITAGGLKDLALGQNLTIYSTDPTETLTVQNCTLVNCLIQAGTTLTDCNLENCFTEATSEYFADAANADFRLDSLAIGAIDQGKDLGSEFTTDISGLDRGYDVEKTANFDSGAWDIGAYELDSQAQYIYNAEILHSAPAAPMLTYPADGATGVSPNTLLIWAYSGAAPVDHYKLEWSTDAGFLSGDMTVTGITTTTYQLLGLEADTVYYWRVLAMNAYGESEWSVAGSYTTADDGIYADSTALSYTMYPNETLADSLALSSGAGAEFTWSAMDDAVWLSLTPAMGTVGGGADDQLGISISSSGLEAGSTYTAVITLSASGAVNSPVSIPVVLTIVAKTSDGGGDGEGTVDILPPELLSPADGEGGLDDGPVLSWASATNATGYIVQVGRDPDFTMLTVSYELTALQYQPVGMEKGATYYWRVKSVSNMYLSGWSSTRWFALNPAEEDPAKKSCFLGSLLD